MAFDTIIRGGLVADGNGNREPFVADVGIRDDRIADIGDLAQAQASSEIHAAGKIVCPGFIDVHVHSEIALVTGKDRHAGVAQGVTTQLSAPDGFGWACLPPEVAREMWAYTGFACGDVSVEPVWPDIASYLGIFQGNTPCNLALQVPHCAVRLQAMGWDARPASNDELEAMAASTRSWMEAGACGLCLGLDYQPTANADLRELVTLTRVVAEYGGLYAAHQRYHTIGRKAAWEETFEICRQSGAPVHVSHERVDPEAGELLERAQAEGLDVTFESYLYGAGMSHMTIMLPIDIQRGTPDEVATRLKEPDIRTRSLPTLKGRLGAADQVVGYTRSGLHIGRRLSDLAREAGKTPEAFAYDLIIEEDGLCTYVFPWPGAADEIANAVDNTVGHPMMMIASDGIYNIPHPHPRGFGCFARVLGHYVRERGMLTVSEAVHKMSGMPARRFGLTDRGEVAVGKAADLVVFDPQTVGSPATFEDPMRPPVGIHRVIVNGETVMADGSPTGVSPGRVLRRNA